MLKPELKPDDVFHIIGFTHEDILSGAQIRAMEIQSENLKMMVALHGTLGPLAVAAERGLVILKPLEVYFLDPFVSLGDDSFEKQYGRKFQVVDYYGETALELSKRFNLKLPAAIGQLSREQLPKRFGISIKGITYMLPSTSAAFRASAP